MGGNFNDQPPAVETGPWIWYMETPVVSRVYLTAAVLTTAACALEIISPFSLYFNPTLIKQGQLWRLVTNFVYFGSFSLDFLFHMYFLVSPHTPSSYDHFSFPSTIPACCS